MLGRLLLCIGVLWLGACNSTGQAHADASYTGTLQGGMMGIGGEHTGWILKTDQQPESLEVDISAVAGQAQSLQGQPVVITGHMRTKDYVERGPTPILVAEAIRPASSR